MALNSVTCDDVPLRNCSLTPGYCEYGDAARDYGAAAPVWNGKAKLLW